MSNKTITISEIEYEFLQVQSKLYENLLLQIKYRLKKTKYNQQNAIELSQKDASVGNCEYKRITKQLIREMNFWICQEDEEIE